MDDLAEKLPLVTGLENAKFYAIVHNPGVPVALRYGPFDGKTTGEIMRRCVDGNIPLLITADMGDDIDWTMASEMAMPEGHKADEDKRMAQVMDLILGTARVLRSVVKGREHQAASMEEILAPFKDKEVAGAPSLVHL